MSFVDALLGVCIPLCCVAACLAPQLTLIGVNIPYFTNRQIRLSVLCLIAIGCLAGGGAWAAGSLLDARSTIHLGFFGSPSQLLGCATATGLLLFFGERSLHEGIPNLTWRILAGAAVAGAMFASTLLGSLALPAVCLLVVCGFACHDIKKGLPRARFPLFPDAPPEQLERPEAFPPLPRFQQRPNIYVFYLESVHSSEAVREIYGIDGTNTDRFLKDRGFTLFPDFLASNYSTGGSAIALFSRQIHISNESVAEYPIVFRVFRENGYAIRFVDKSAHLFGRWSWLADWCSFSQGAVRTWLLQNCIPLFFSCRTLCLLCRIIYPLDTVVKNQENFAVIHEAATSMLNTWKDERPTFSVIRFGAEHTEDAGMWDPAWLKEYPSLYRQAQKQIEIMTDLVLEHDPDAVIITVGDHGARWNGWKPSLEALNKLPPAMRERAIDPRRLTLNIFSVPLAIRWPSGRFPLPVYSHVNLFAAVFAVLSGDNACLENQHHDISLLVDFWKYQPGWLVAAERGRWLRPPRPIGKQDIMNMLATEIKIDPYNIKAYEVLLGMILATGSLAADQIQQAVDLALLLSARFGDDRWLNLIKTFQASPGAAAAQEASQNLAKLIANETLLIMHLADATCPPDAASCVEQAPPQEKPSPVLKRFAADLADRHKACLSGDPLPRGSRSRMMEQAAWLQGMNGNTEEAERLCLQILNSGETESTVPACWLLCFLLSQRGAWEEACAMANHCDDSSRLAILLLVRSQQWEQALALLQQRVDSASCGVWDIALYAAAYARTRENVLDWLMAAYAKGMAGSQMAISYQIGLHAVIHRLNDDALKSHKHFYQKTEQGDTLVIRQANLFDEDYYRKNLENGFQDNKIRMSGLTHFVRYGMFALHNPCASFDMMLYLFLNPEIYMTTINPFGHYIQKGHAEGRVGTLFPAFRKA